MENVTFEHFKTMDLRVAEIRSCEDIEGADKIHKLTIVTVDRNIPNGSKVS